MQVGPSTWTTYALGVLFPVFTTGTSLPAILPSFTITYEKDRTVVHDLGEL